MAADDDARVRYQLAFTLGEIKDGATQEPCWATIASPRRWRPAGSPGRVQLAGRRQPARSLGFGGNRQDLAFK